MSHTGDTQLFDTGEDPVFIITKAIQKVEKIIPVNKNDPCLYKISVTRARPIHEVVPSETETENPGHEKNSSENISPIETTIPTITTISGTIELQADELLTSTKFRWKWLSLFNEPLKISNKVWGEVLFHLMRRVRIGTEDAISNEQYLADCIINDIQQRHNETEREKVVQNSLLRLIEEKLVLIPSTHIKQIMDQEKINVNLRRLREILNPYLAENSRQLRVGNASIRFWCFCPDKLQINTEDVDGEPTEDLEL